MVSQENRVIVTVIALAMVLAVVVLPAFGAPRWLVLATMTVVGVLIPGYLTGRHHPERDQ
jgi:predicted MFS family arabinose efflux permease